MGFERGSDRLVVEEACALAILCRHEEALKLLGALSIESIGDPVCLSAQLLRAIIRIARGNPGDLLDARTVLEGLLGDPRTCERWRPSLALARLEQREGRVLAAAALLKDAFDGFRADGEIQLYGGALLAEMVLEEVDRLERADTEDAADAPKREVAPDPNVLLRLIELGRSLADETDPDRILRLVLHEAIELSGLDRGFVVILNDADLDFALAENLDWSEVEQPAFEVSRTLVRKSLEDSKAIFVRVAEADADAEAARSLAEIGAHSVACVPMIHGSATRGALYLDGRDASHAFTGAKERLIELFASQAAAALDNALAHRSKTQALQVAQETIRRQRGQGRRRDRYFELIGASEAMQDVYCALDRIVPTEMGVLILGETGTGKELAAGIIHAQGPRKDRKFVATNCASVAETLLEAELFGHERGAFTGADRARPGLFEVADRGTLFLDEVGDMSPRMQADLLRVLQSGEVRRVGARDTKRVDVRVIAATHRDLEQLIGRDLFRQDLFFRLNVLSLTLPPLRDRRDDIPLLLAEILARLASGQREAPQIAERAMRLLATYAWPGNVRELENVARRLLVQEVDRIEAEHLPAEILKPVARSEHSGSLQRAESDAIRRALQSSAGRRADAARILGIDRKTLYVKLKRLQLEP